MNCWLLIVVLLITPLDLVKFCHPKSCLCKWSVVVWPWGHYTILDRNFNVGFPPRRHGNAKPIKLDITITCIKFYTYLPVSLTLNRFQGHSGFRRMKVKAHFLDTFCAIHWPWSDSKVTKASERWKWKALFSGQVSVQSNSSYIEYSWTLSLT